MKKIIFILCTLCFAVSVLAHDFEVDGIYYNILSDTTVAVTYKGTSTTSAAYKGTMIIPANVTYNNINYNVTSIGKNAFTACTTLDSISIPNSVKAISDYAFGTCTSLTSIVIPDGVISLGTYVFYSCTKLQKVSIPSSVIEIGTKSFFNTSIYNTASNWENGGLYIDDCLIAVKETFKGAFTVKENTRLIGGGATSYNNSQIPTITAVTIPASVIHIGCGFGSQVTTVYYNGTIAQWCKINFAVANPVCPTTKNVYMNNELITELIIPNDITKINSRAFANWTFLTSLTIPENIKHIGEWAFAGCTSLTSVSLPEGLNCIEKNTFNNCDKLNFITIPNSITTIGDSAFHSCDKLASITIPNSVTSIGVSAFCYCWALDSISLSQNLTRIEGATFRGCNNLNYIVIPNSVNSIGGAAFMDCYKLTELIIPNEITSIEVNAFHSCKSLTSLKIPKKITYIGYNAFEGCSALTSFYIEATTPPTLYSTSSLGIPSSCPIYIPCGTMSAYKSAWGNRKFVEPPLEYTLTLEQTANGIVENTQEITCANYTANLVATPDLWYQFVRWSDGNTENPRVLTLTSDTVLSAEFAFSTNWQCGDNLYWSYEDGTLTITGDGPMWDFTSTTIPWYSARELIQSIVFPADITHIGDSAFLHCSSISSITIPENITSIGKDAFSGCTALKTVQWNAKDCADFSDIPSSPFGNIYEKITSFTFGDNVEHVPAYLCCGMSGLTSIIIPNSVKTIGLHAFSSCESITSISIPSSVISIGNYAFYMCRGISNLSIGSNVETIGDYAFQYCSITSLSIPNSVTTIGEYAFDWCSKLSSVTIGSGVRSIGNLAFWHTSIQNVVWNARHYDDIMDKVNPFTDWNLLKITSFTFGEAVEHIPAYICYQLMNLSSVTIGSNVTSIGEGAFSKCTNIEKVVWNAKNLPDFADASEAPFYDSQETITSFTFGTTVEHIPSYLCSDMIGLTSVTIGDGVSSIGGSAFYNCYSLSYLKLGNTIKTIGDYAFADCNSLATLTIPNSVKSIEYAAFQGCSSLTSITVPSGNIASYAFSYCSDLTSVSIGSGVTNIGTDAFGYCNDLASIRVINSNAYYDSREYCNAIIETATNTLIAGCYNTIIPYGVTAIGEYAFSACDNLTSIEIPNSVTTIGNMAFSGCSNLTSITIPNSVKSIGSRAFRGCLTKVYVKATTPPEIADNTFSTSPICYVPCGTIDAYSTTNWMSSCSEIIEEQLYQIYLTVAPHDYGIVEVVSRPDCDNAIISATPNEGYTFVIWSDGNTQATRHIALSQDVSLKAYFAQEGHTIHVYQDCTVTVE